MKYILFFILTAIASVALQAQDTSSYQYLGKYKFPDGSVVAGVEVTMDNGTLVMSSSAGVSNLALLGRDSFNIVSFNGFAVFRRNDNKKVVAVHIEASGYILDGPKDSTAVSVQGKHLSPGIIFPEKIYSNRQEAAKALSGRRDKISARRVPDGSEL